MSSQNQTSPLIYLHNKPTRKNKRVYVCAFPSCGYHTSSIKTLKIHDDIHTLGCGCYVSDRSTSAHRCTSNCSQSGQSLLPFNPDNVDLGIFSRKNQAFGGTISEYKYQFTETIVNISTAMSIVNQSLINLLEQLLKYFKNIKLEVILSVSLLKLEKKEVMFRFLNAGTHKIINAKFIGDVLRFIEDILHATLSIFVDGGSNFSLVSINDIQLKIYQYMPIKPRVYIRTPKELSKRKGYCNIETSTNKCFLLSVLCCLSEYRNQIQLPCQDNKTFDQLTTKEQALLRRLWSKESSYDQIIDKILETQSLNICNFYDCDIDDLHQFEISNKIGIACFELIESNVVPVYLPTQKYERNVHLLVIQEFKSTKHDILRSGDAEKVSHYIAIYNKDKFFGKQGRSKRQVCTYCLKSCTPGSYQSHIDECREVSKLKLKFISEPKARYTFNKLHMTQSLDIAVFFSLKLLSEKLSFPTDWSNEKCQYNYTTPVSNLQVSHYFFMVVCLDSGRILYEEASSYKPDILEQFITHALYTAEVCAKLVATTYKKAQMTVDERKAHKQAMNCCICNKSFTSNKNLAKCLHHSHFSSRYLGVCTIN